MRRSCRQPYICGRLRSSGELPSDAQEGPPFMEEPTCAASSATPAARKRNRSSSRACAGWNIAATTAPAWRPLTGSRLHLRKRAGRIARPGRYLRDQPAPGCVGISHTRWATHGPANDRNAHPHLGGDGLRRRRPQRRHRELRRPQAQLASGGRRLPQRHRHRGHRPPDRPPAATATDDLVEAVPQGAGRCSRAPTAWRSSARCSPDVVVGARLGSPLVLGLGEGEHFLASDPAPWSATPTRSSISQDHQLCVLTPDDWQILDRERSRVEAADRADRLGAGRRRQGRLRSLHAQGDLRAARSAGERPARPARRRRRPPPTSAA